MINITLNTFDIIILITTVKLLFVLLGLKKTDITHKAKTPMGFNLKGKKK